MKNFYDLWNRIGGQCDLIILRRMEEIAWIDKGSTDGILERAYDE